MELCRKEFTLQRMQGLVKSGISGIIYIYILRSRLKLELRSEERNSVEDRGKNFRDTQDRTKEWFFRSLRSFSWR